jgi:cytochrome c peroxidase
MNATHPVPSRAAALGAGLFLMVLLAAPAGAARTRALTPPEALGKRIFFDAGLSRHRNQSCASCHSPAAGFAGPDSAFNAGGAVYEGSVAGRFGNRRPQSAAYATPSPVFHSRVEEGEKLFVGGNFWDGRATGERLGSPAAEQAQGPFLNPVEQGLPDAACVVRRVCAADYGADFRALHPQACDIAFPKGLDEACAKGRAVKLAPAVRKQVRASYDRIALAIAAYEHSPEVNAYSSKFDAVQAGRAIFTPQEAMGLDLFKGKGKCADCHPVDRGPGGEPPIFTDNTFDNLGVPRNPANPWYKQPKRNPAGAKWVDEGLGAFLRTRADLKRDAAGNVGKQRVPTLRNVDQRPDSSFVKAYMHNGYFKSLGSVVHFYNTRDAKPRCPDPLTTEEEALKRGCWPAPETAANLNREELGDLKLTKAEEEAIVAFMRTLTDGYTAPK